MDGPSLSIHMSLKSCLNECRDVLSSWMIYSTLDQYSQDRYVRSDGDGNGFLCLMVWHFPHLMWSHGYYQWKLWPKTKCMHLWTKTSIRMCISYTFALVMSLISFLICMTSDFMVSSMYSGLFYTHTDWSFRLVFLKRKSWRCKMERNFL